jgi:hypothetical protein
LNGDVVENTVVVGNDLTLLPGTGIKLLGLISSCLWNSINTVFSNIIDDMLY